MLRQKALRFIHGDERKGGWWKWPRFLSKWCIGLLKVKGLKVLPHAAYK